MSGYPHPPPIYGYGSAPPPVKPYPSAPAPYGAPPPGAAPPGQHQHQHNPSPYGAPPQGGGGGYPAPGPPHSGGGGYPAPAPGYGSPFAALVPSPFPPGTDPNVVACFQIADQDGSSISDGARKELPVLHNTDPIPYEQLERSHPDAFFKQLTRSDVNDRLVVTKEMARFMPQANHSEIRVLDDFGDTYRFVLAKRIGSSKKPTFLPRGSKFFMKKREAQPGDCIFFWQEANEMKGTNYRIHLVSSIIHGVFPKPEGLGDHSNMAPPESQEETSDLRAWAIHGGLKL